MNPVWSASDINDMFVRNCEPFSLDNLNPGLTNQTKSKSIAFVNPKHLFPYSFLNASHLPVSKFIHINPNFKIVEPCDTSVPKGEISKPDINQVNIQSIQFHSKNNVKNCNTVTTTSHLKDSVPLSQEHSKERNKTISRTLLEQNTEEYGFTRKSGMAIRNRNQSNVFSVKNEYKNGNHNSSYFWSKDNTTSGSFKLHIPVWKSGKGKILHNTFHLMSTPLRETSCLSKNGIHIKTKHKIVNRIETNINQHKMVGQNNHKYKLRNPYKIVNVKNQQVNSFLKADINLPKNKKNSSLSLTTCYKSSLRQHPCLERKVHLVNHLSEKSGTVPKQGLSKLVKNSFINRMSNAIKSKYIYNRFLMFKKKEQKLFNADSLKYKVDQRRFLISKRKINVEVPYENVKLFPTPNSVQNSRLIPLPQKVTKRYFGFRFSNYITWRKQELNKKLKKEGAKIFHNKTVVNIGGILYRASANKLTRTGGEKLKMQERKGHPNSGSIISGKMHHIVYVRGEKFLLDVSGKTLIRQPSLINTHNGKKYNIGRIHIGGVTYIQKSTNVLVQTNTHEARSLVHYAKRKSINILHNLHKRNNTQCMLYKKFGMCTRFNKGQCLYVHDPKNIDLCKKFLKGECHNSLCLLSHNKIEEKMATCHFFLKGSCNREKCPYLHVKVNRKAGICRSFLQGFCALGQNCKKRHVHQCPDFDEKGVCCKGVSCPYPHKTKRNSNVSHIYKSGNCEVSRKISPKQKPKGIGLIEQTDIASRANIETKKSRDSKNIKRQKIKKKKMLKENQEKLEAPSPDDDSIVECIPKRIKLDNLPLFIPLDIE